MRLFIAVNLPAALRATLYERAAGLRAAITQIRWLPADNFHITIKFLGAVENDRVDAVQAALAEAAGGIPPFDLQIGGFGAFPGLARPNVVWLGVKPASALMELQQRVEQMTAPLGFETEARAFHPHITIGRLAARTRAPDLRGLERVSASLEYEKMVAITTVELMESKLSSKGARYESIASARLKEKSSE